MTVPTLFVGFGKRFVALIIDAIIIGFLAGIVANMITSNEMFSSVLSGLFELSYSIYFLVTYGQTIGKMAMKIKVVKENGDKLTVQDALIRELSKVLSAIVVCVGYMWVLWDPKKQAWHDKIAKTVVIPQ